MQLLTQRQVLVKAASVGGITALAAWPKLALWETRPGSTGYLLLILFWAAFCLCGFVFAWHEEWMGKKPFSACREPRLWLAATALGMLISACMFYGLDPHTRPLQMALQPHTFTEWLAMILFSLGFEQLFLCFAPFAFFLRLFQNPRLATQLVVAFGVLILVLKLNSVETPISMGLATGMTFGRVLTASIAIFLYRRGGVFLVTWWGFLLEARNLAWIFH